MALKQPCGSIYITFSNGQIIEMGKDEWLPGIGMRWGEQSGCD